MKWDTGLDWSVLSPYAGRWVAVVRGRVVGVGWTEEEARRAAKRVMFVPAVEVCGDEG
jgi:hypothetical protein